MFYVYIIKSKEGRYYIGSTENIEKRLQQHNSIENKGWTSRFTDWKLVYSETYQIRKQAIIRERQIKKIITYVLSFHNQAKILTLKLR